MEKSHEGGDAWLALAVLLQPPGWLCEWGSHLSIQTVKTSAVISTEQHLTATSQEAPCENCLSESINPQLLEIMIQYGVHTGELEQSLFQKGPSQVRRDTTNLSHSLTNGGWSTQPLCGPCLSIDLLRDCVCHGLEASESSRVPAN